MSAERSKPTFKLTDLKRAIHGFQEMGLTVTGARIAPDGSIEVLTGKNNRSLSAVSDPLADWERKHGKSSAA